MQTVSIIVATGRNREIGRDGAIPWHLRGDLARFKVLTIGHPVVMGRKTHESIGKPLPGRRNIVITRQPDYRAGGCEVVHSLKEALRLAGDGEVFVIGGAEIYKEALPIANRIYLTLVDGDFPGDAHFPEINGNVWREVRAVPGPKEEKNNLRYTFLMFERST